MSLSMSKASAVVFIQILKGLHGVLDKAALHAESNKIDPSALLQARLYPDMFPLTRQVQICCDFAKGAAGRLAGDDFPVFEDSETSFADLKARVSRTIAYVESLDPSAIDGSETRDIALVRRGETTVHKGESYLLHQALPNFYFHAVTAYDILRHNGVPVGKRDFLGPA
jgi:hypothetical protein